MQDRNSEKGAKSFTRAHRPTLCPAPSRRIINILLDLPVAARDAEFHRKDLYRQEYIEGK
jgi:hypothetical protein